MKNIGPVPLIFKPVALRFLIFILCLFTYISCEKDKPEEPPCTEQQWFKDSDGDGQGNKNSATMACEQPEGYVADNNDPDDTNAAITSDCEMITYYPDDDGDGYGEDGEAVITQCTGVDAPTGYVADNTDCDDTDPDVNTGEEVTIYKDADGDEYGDLDTSQTVSVCSEIPDDYVLDNTDCDDTDPEKNGDITVFEDNDDDGLGNPEVSQTISGCSPIPDGYVLDNTDCNDNAGPFIAADWESSYLVDRTTYATDGTSSESNFECSVEAVEGQPNTLKLIGFWGSGYADDNSLLITIDPCTQKATWDQTVAIGFYPWDPLIGDIHWERIDEGGYESNSISLNLDDEYGWCTLDFENKTIQLFGVATIPDHDVFIKHCESNLSIIP